MTRCLGGLEGALADAVLSFAISIHEAFFDGFSVRLLLHDLWPLAK